MGCRRALCAQQEESWAACKQEGPDYPCCVRSQEEDYTAHSQGTHPVFAADKRGALEFLGRGGALRREMGRKKRKHEYQAVHMACSPLPFKSWIALLRYTVGIGESSLQVAIKSLTPLINLFTPEEFPGVHLWLFKVPFLRLVQTKRISQATPGPLVLKIVLIDYN